jgi:predicted NUDIX family NTP pyrophosphohydrolase
MARKDSVGILVYRRHAGGIELFLVHPGGPFWAKKDLAAWSIPKGLLEEGEDPLAAAKREFREETGQTVDGGFRALTPCKQPGGKVVSAWLVEAEVDAERIESNEFTIEWPPRSGRTASFPEVDRAGWFPVEQALQKVHKGQRPIILEAVQAIGPAAEDGKG